MKLTLEEGRIEQLVSILTLMDADDPDIAIVADVIAQCARSADGEPDASMMRELCRVLQKVFVDGGHDQRIASSFLRRGVALSIAGGCNV